MQQTGFKICNKDGTEYIFKAGGDETTLPVRYSYRKFLPEVINQGEDPICVPCTISAYLNWRENLNNGTKKDYEIDYQEIFDSRTSNEEGMTFKEAFKYLRHTGVSSKLGKLKIGTYAMVRNSMLLRFAIFLNGPCMGALPMYNETDEFWNQYHDDYLKGYHAVAIVGYDEDGFLIRNSWGRDYGDKGYAYIKEEDFKKFIELWTVSD